MTEKEKQHCDTPHLEEKKWNIVSRSLKIAELARKQIFTFLIIAPLLTYSHSTSEGQDGGIAEKITKIKEDEKRKISQSGELYGNYVDSWAFVFSKLKRSEFVFVDKNGNIIGSEIFRFPENWDNFSDDEKQQVLDTHREDLSKKFGISATEWNMRFSSMRKLLQDENSVLADFTRKNMYDPVHEDVLKRAKVDYIQEEFRILTEKNTIDEFITKNIVGLVANESQYNNNVTSPSGAFGVMQLMPGKIRNSIVNPREYTEDEVRSSIPKQVELAKNLFINNYSQLKKFTRPVAHAYFDGDIEKAERYVIAPAVLNAYNTGGPNVSQMISFFLEYNPNLQVFEENFGKKYQDHPGMDVFYRMTTFAYENKEELCSEKEKTDKEDIKKPKTCFGTDSRDYVRKTMAMTKILSGDSIELPEYKWLQ